MSTSAVNDILNAFNMIFGAPMGGYIAGAILIFGLLVFITIATEELSILSILIASAIGIALSVAFGWWPGWVAYFLVIAMVLGILMQLQSRKSASGGGGI